MLRKSFCILILFSMTLHCTSRLGLLSFLYQKRHTIAYSIGMIAELPIAMCNSDYDFGKSLKIEATDSDERIPNFAQAHEINLFLVSSYQFPIQKRIPLDEFIDSYFDFVYQSPPRSIFHPPALA